MKSYSPKLFIALFLSFLVFSSSALALTSPIAPAAGVLESYMTVATPSPSSGNSSLYADGEYYGGGGTLSPALNMLSRNVKMLVATLPESATAATSPGGGEAREIALHFDAFREATGMSGLTSVTITALPPACDGVLMLGGIPLAENGVVSAENTEPLIFAASAEAEASAFEFLPMGGRYLSPLKCEIKLLSSLNVAPMADNSEIEAASSVAIYSSLSAFDSDGDALVFDIETYPENGTLRLLDKTTGEYVYTPKADFGGDSFTFCASDSCGNVSNVARVKIEPLKTASRFYFSDMLNLKTHTAAVKIADIGIMSGESIGAVSLFHPEDTLTRFEFLVAAMACANISPAEGASESVARAFADYSSLSHFEKAYFSAACNIGIINGVEQSDGSVCLCAREDITREQAAAVIARIYKYRQGSFIEALALSAERSEDDWREAIVALADEGIIPLTEAGLAPGEVLTRGDAAQIFYNFLSTV